MIRWTWAYGLTGLAALLIACGDQPVPRDPTPGPPPTLPTPTAPESAALHLAELVPWFREPLGAAGAEAARLLVELWLRDDSLGKAVAALPWIASAPVGEEIPTALGALRDIADPIHCRLLAVLSLGQLDIDTMGATYFNAGRLVAKGTDGRTVSPQFVALGLQVAEYLIYVIHAPGYVHDSRPAFPVAGAPGACRP